MEGFVNYWRQYLSIFDKNSELREVEAFLTVYNKVL